MSKVVIDCRYLGMSGIGRVLENILDILIKDKTNDYILWGKKDNIIKYDALEYIFDEDTPFQANSMFNKNIKEINNYDYLFTPNFIIPFGVKIKVISMIHDMIFLDMKDVNKNKLEYFIKRYLLKRCTKKSKNILTVSNFTKNRIIYYYPKSKNKIDYSYLGVANSFKKFEPVVCKKNQIVFVGNIKKHKGLKVLFEAFNIVKSNNSDMKLYIVGDKDSFRNNDAEMVNHLNDEGVIFTGKLGDVELKKVISESMFLIQPSFYEGFGLPPLEALYLGTKPIISDIEVFKEIYSDLLVTFFKCGDSKDLAEKIQNSSIEINNDEDYYKKYSYDNLAQIILSKII